MSDDGLIHFSDVLGGVAGGWRKVPAIARLLRNMVPATEATRRSLGTVLQETARRFPDQVAVKWSDGRWTWRVLDRLGNRVAHALAARGVRQGDAVGVFLSGGPEVLLVTSALAKLGAVSVMLNPGHRQTALRHSLTCAPLVLCVVSPDLAPALRAVECPVPLVPIARAFAGGTDLLAEALRFDDDPPASLARVRLGDPAFYIFTSGTTGLPKASIMSHYRWVGAGHMFGEVLLGLKPRDTVYAPLPLYHNQGLTMCWSSCVRTGAALALPERFTASGFWEDCRKHQATVVAYIGEIARYLLGQPPTPDERRHRVRKAVGVGMRPDLWGRFKQRFSIDEIYEFYSASELNVGFFNLLNLDKTVGFCPASWALVAYDPDDGTPTRGNDGRLVRLGRGDTGLLVTRVTERFRFEGYTDPAATEQKLLHDVFKPGDCWVNTGDVMRHLGFGHLQFVDRLGDTFRWKGENVATTEVEAVAANEPSVADVTVYGVRVPEAAGRAGMMTVVPANGGVDRDALLSRLFRELPPYAVPVFLREAEALEVTGTFKHVKHKLRNDGFDPARTTDPIWVRLPGDSTWRRVTPGIYDRIAAREVGF